MEIITVERLNALESRLGIKTLTSQEEFAEILKLEKAILYLQVVWSGPERFSRFAVYTILNELDLGIPIFKIDYSNPSINVIRVEMIVPLIEPNYLGGWGETALLQNGKCIDFIPNPGALGLAKTREKILQWNTL